ncbi:Structural maintenance of chromosomes protein 3 [Platanthera zijinensis]|uniref:Structural maintenance of chromosomes protein 3 n=1 Tax=Platanthera zijinensis TaxID=2320716 RepID=A0AAP0G067_9ASPA
MYIKKIIIEGFKSYKEEVSTEPFSPKVNCVVGANGSGKTNFFHAIRFVLSDLIQNLRSEDRQALLHEGAGHQVISAFVEIVFDNSDNRIPVDKEEVRLRRTIGVKKDECFLDGKHVTSKTEVINLLESAGFSRSNPYYVVQQGKITSLTLMKDSERLDLLKEIGGTRVYEERRRESLKIMQETGNKRKQIDQVVQYLEERLRDLDEEKEELKKYQQLDKKIRSLEYIILEKEMDDAAQKLREIEDARNTVSEKSTSMHNKILKNHDRLKELEKDYKTFTKAIQGLNKDKEVIEKRRTEALKIRTQYELDLKDIEERYSGDIRAKEDAARQLKGLRKEIEDSRNELNAIRPLHNEKIAQEEGFIKGIMECEKQLSILYQKQGRSTQFASKAARDKWLQREIDDLQRPLFSHLGQEKKLQEEIQQLKDEENKMDAYIEEQRAEAKRKELSSAKIQEEFNRLRVQRDELQDKRKTLWKSEGELSSEIEKLRLDLVKAKKSLDHATPGDTRRGLNSVDRYVNDHNIEGVFGSLLELIECDEKFFTSVEVTAGNSLFHVVVATDEISSRIIRYLTSEKGGRVTFIPLNRVNVQRINYPQSSDVVPLLKKLKYPSACSPAFQQVFSRTVICRDLDVATSVARGNGLDCITLEGDQVSKKGGMTGGFYDSRRSKLKFMNIIKQSKSSILQKTDELEKISKELQDILMELPEGESRKEDEALRLANKEAFTLLVGLVGLTLCSLQGLQLQFGSFVDVNSVRNREINNLVSRQQRIEAERGHMKSELEQLKQDIANTIKQKQSISRVIEKKGKLLGNALTQIDQIRAGIAMKRAEMGTDLVDQLTTEEKVLLSRLNPEITQLKEKLLDCTTSRIEIETRKEELETNLSTNLVKRQQELEAIILSADSGTLPTEADLKRQELEHSNGTVVELMKQLNRTTEEEYERTLQDEAKDLEQLLNKRNVFLSKQDDCKRKIRDLGSLPSDAFERYLCSL